LYTAVIKIITGC